MAETFNKDFRGFQKALSEHITIFEYRQIRYKINFSVVMFYSREPIDFSDMLHFLQKRPVHTLTRSACRLCSRQL